MRLVGGEHPETFPVALCLLVVRRTRRIDRQYTSRHSCCIFKVRIYVDVGVSIVSDQTFFAQYGYCVGKCSIVPMGTWILCGWHRDREGHIVLRIFSNKWHVYAGLAILNPAARRQIKQYAQSTTDIFKLMLAADETWLRKRLYDAKDAVFQQAQRPSGGRSLLSECVLDQFGLSKKDPLRNAVALLQTRISRCLPW